MNQIVALQRENKQLKEQLQDAVALACKFKREMGVIDQEELDRLSATANGTSFNAKNWDLADRNGEQ